jgi:hypothetical protein
MYIYPKYWITSEILRNINPDMALRKRELFLL